MNKVIKSVEDRGYEIQSYCATATGAVIMVDRKTEHHPYVTWIASPDGATFHGNYFESKQKAMEDFIARTERRVW